MVQSVPHELNNDSLHVLALTQDSGYTNAESIVDALKWEMSRAQNALVKVVDLGYAHKRWDMLD